MGTISVSRKMDLNKGTAEKVDSFFGQICNFIEANQITRKDCSKLSFSREEKLKLFAFFEELEIPMDRSVCLNESIQQDHFVDPFELMDLLRKHR